MSPAFLDTNILLRHLLQDQPQQGVQASAILDRVETGSLPVMISDIVVFETVYTLERSYRLSRQSIVDGVRSILEIPNLHLEGKRLYRRVFELYLSSRAGFADCYHAALMEREGVTEVYSFDRDFDRLPGIQRLEA